MDLVYLYVGKIGKIIGNFGISFSRIFSVDFNQETGELFIKKLPSVVSDSSIYGKNIKDVDLIVGKNGSGKTTILSLLGLSRDERLSEYPIYLNEKNMSEENKCTWFALYHIEKNVFAIEGNWCDTLEFMKGDMFHHLQPLYSICFKYDFEKKSCNYVRPLQEFSYRKKADFHKKLFFLFYDNPVSLEWVTSVKRFKRYDYGSGFMFERVMCERVGYQGIVRYLYAASHDTDFMTLMGTKPGTTIKITIYDDDKISDYDDFSILSSKDIVYQDSMGRYFVDKKKAAEFIYGGKLQLIESRYIDILKSIRKDELLDDGLNFKESFIISYLEQIAVFAILNHLRKGLTNDKELKFNIREINKGQNQYEWRKWHLLFLIQKLIGENKDYYLVLGILSGLENVPGSNYISTSEIEVSPIDMEDNFLDELMSSLDDNQLDEENHEINHRYYIRTEFKGISNGEARLIDIFAMLFNSLSCCCHSKNDTCVILLDEPDMGFHPEWSRLFIDKFTDFLNSKMMSDYKYHIIISTHSPIMLSDVPRNCIHCISRNKDNKIDVRTSEKYGLISSINDILIDDFFTDSVFGSFAEKYVNDIINNIKKLEKQLNERDFDTYEEYCNICDKIEAKIECLGEGYIKSSIQRRLNQQRNIIKRLYEY